MTTNVEAMAAVDAESVQALRERVRTLEAKLQSQMDMLTAAEALLDLIHTLGEQRAPGDDRPMLVIDTADDVTAEAVKERLNALWELVKNSEPAPDPTGYVQIPGGTLRACQRRAERAEACVEKLTQLVRDIDEALGKFTEYTPPLLRWIRIQIQEALR